MGRPRKTDDGIVKYEARCKVCNSQFKNVIESLYNNNLNPRQIFEALNALQDDKSKKILAIEQLSESSIARHLEKHYSVKATTALKQAENAERLLKSRELFKDGVQNKINTISTLSHLIDVALINLESLDQFPDGRQRHQLTINYMGQIKGLIDEFSKLTGELQTENTFDINFWNVQITEFANIVIQTIRKMDHQFNLNNQLEYSFGMEFKKTWDQYRETQKKIFDGELPINYGEKERNINTFNILPDYNKKEININDNNIIKEEDNIEDVQYFNSLNNEDNNINENESNTINENKEENSIYNDLYHTHYLSEDEDFQDNTDELNTLQNIINDEDIYNDQNIINSLHKQYKNIPVEKINEELEYVEDNQDNIIINKDKTNLYMNQRIINKASRTNTSIKQMQNTLDNLKNKYLKK